MRILLLCLSLFVAWPAFAVEPDEILPDAALEARAREISKLLRCPVCQGETIDESNAPISRDLRVYLRERLVAGDSDPQVIEAITDRFGEFVLFEPPARGWNWLLWLAGPIMALIALLVAARFLRARSKEEVTTDRLSAAEKDRLERIMRD